MMSFQVNGEKKTETKEESIILSKVCVCVCIIMEDYCCQTRMRKKQISIRLRLEKLIDMN